MQSINHQPNGTYALGSLRLVLRPRCYPHLNHAQLGHFFVKSGHVDHTCSLDTQLRTVSYSPTCLTQVQPRLVVIASGQLNHDAGSALPLAGLAGGRESGELQV
jgi:hypothetical protein